MEKKNVLVVGLGLIGGSLIKALKTLDYQVFGIEKDHEVLTASRVMGLIQNSDETNEQLLEKADIIFISLYPEAAIEFIESHQHLFKKHVILTDVVGLKDDFMTRVEKFIRDDIYFVGGHPMAGKEGSGFYASCASIFHNANYLLISDDKLPQDVYDRLSKIIYGIGCGHIEVMTAAEHDAVIAYTSHMPHILSSTFKKCNRFDKTKHCIAGSFKDFTRVSDINADLWSELILDNKAPVLNEIEHFKKSLQALEEAIINSDQDTITELLLDGKRKKSQLHA